MRPGESVFFMCGFYKVLQKYCAGNGSPAGDGGEVAQVSDMAFHALGVFVVKRHWPYMIAGVSGGVSQAGAQLFVFGEKTGSHVAQSDHASASKSGNVKDG